MEQLIANNSNMDGAVQMYDVVYAENNIGGNYNDNDTFYPATGRLRNAAANLKRNSGKNREIRRERRTSRIKRRDVRATSKADARINRTGAKVTQAQAQQEAAKGLSDPSADIALSKSLATMTSGPSPSAEKKGLSTMAWVGIGVGVLALGVGAYFVFKKK